MGMVYREIKQGLIDIETMFALLRRAAGDRRIGRAPSRCASTTGEISFENVSLRLRAGPADPEGRLASRCRPGRMVAIVGPSGAGKSTISRILFRFYDVDGGRVPIDGQDIRDVTQNIAARRHRHGAAGHRAVQRHHSLQHPLRPPGCQRRGGATRRRGWRRSTTSSCRCREATTRMVGERGLKLSGGEKQRVAIARTILKGPPHPDARRGDLRARQPHREGDPGRARAGRARTAHRSSSPIASRPSSTPTTSSCSTRGRSSSRARTGASRQGRLYASLWKRQREAEKRASAWPR